MPPPPASAPTAATSAPRAPRVTWDDDAYASFLRRAAGFAIDVFAISLLLTLLAPLVGAGDFDPIAMDPSTPPASLQILALVVVLYDVVMTSRFGWTLGKRAVGIEVRTADGRLPWAGLAVGRFFSRYASAAPLLLGFLWALFDGRHQTWHDKLCQTYVLTRSKLRPRDDGSQPAAAGTTTGAGAAPVGEADPNQAAVLAAGLSPGDRAWLGEVAAQVDARLDRVAQGWRYLPSAATARATAFGLLLGHLARRHPGNRPQLSRVAEAHPSFNTLLVGSRLSTLEQIAEDPERVASWLGPLVEERDVERVTRLFD